MPRQRIPTLRTRPERLVAQLVARSCLPLLDDEGGLLLHPALFMPDLHVSLSLRSELGLVKGACMGIGSGAWVGGLPHRPFSRAPQAAPPFRRSTRRISATHRQWPCCRSTLFAFQKNMGVKRLRLRLLISPRLRLAVPAQAYPQGSEARAQEHRIDGLGLARFLLLLRLCAWFPLNHTF